MWNVINNKLITVLEYLLIAKLIIMLIYIVVSFLILVGLKYWVSNLQLSMTINKKVT